MRKILIAAALAPIALLAACGDDEDRTVVSNTTTTYVPQNEQQPAQPKADGNPQP